MAVVLVAAGSVTGPLAQSQRLGTGTASISGVVLAAGTDKPIRGARVILDLDPGKVQRAAITSDNGRFAFIGLPDGDFDIVASKAGYLTMTYGQSGIDRDGTPVHLSAGQAVRDIVLRLPRGAVITGTIRDEAGTAVAGASVILFRRTYVRGVKRLAEVERADSDDRGAYRIYGLPPGQYVVGAQPRPSLGNLREATPAVDPSVLRARTPAAQALARFLAAVPPDEPTATYAPTYYPGTPILAGAAPLTLREGEESSGIDFTVLPVATVTIDGIVTASGMSRSDARVTMRPAQGPVGILQMAAARPDGSFSLTHVPPGEYELVAQTGPVGPRAGSAPSLSGRTIVTVDGHGPLSIAIALESGAVISGSVARDAATASTAQSPEASIWVSVQPVSGSGSGESARAQVDPSAAFTMAGIAPGRYLISVSPPSGQTVVSALVKGRDALDVPFDLASSESVADVRVTLSSKISELTGTVRDASGALAVDRTVIVFATDRTFWTPQSRRIQAARPNTAGTYLIRDLPAGDYRVAVVGDIEPDAWFDPEVLQPLLATSTAVTIEAGGHARLDLTAGR